MKFYRPRSSPHPACLWDPRRGKAIYEFRQGVCVVDDGDTELIALLRMLGFPEAAISPNVQARMDVQQDLRKPAPPPPPDERTVPEQEPPARRVQK